MESGPRDSPAGLAGKALHLQIDAVEAMVEDVVWKRNKTAFEEQNALQKVLFMSRTAVASTELVN